MRNKNNSHFVNVGKMVKTFMFLPKSIKVSAQGFDDKFQLRKGVKNGSYR